MLSSWRIPLNCEFFRVAPRHFSIVLSAAEVVPANQHAPNHRYEHFGFSATLLQKEEEAGKRKIKQTTAVQFPTIVSSKFNQNMSLMQVFSFSLLVYTKRHPWEQET